MQKRQCFLRLWSLAALLTLSTGSIIAAPAPSPQAATSKVQGQVIKVTGTVLDELGEGIPGATVKVKGGSKGAMTDIDGTFTLDIPKGSKIEVSFLGYAPQVVDVNAPTLTITLVPQSELLEEVVSVAYGVQKKESVVGAISTIDASSLKVPVGNLSSAIAGKIAGAVVMQRTAEPGSSADFWIRGIASFGENNRPLILVDGVERSMDLVDPEDIQSFSILKDATATALYGVRGANGIVLITTKRGTESKPKVSAKVEYGFTNPVKIPKMANAEQWIDFYNDVTLDQNGVLAFSPSEKAMYLSGADPDLYPNVDWVNTIFKDQASTTRFNVNITGGTPTVRYYVGGAFYTEGSILNSMKTDTYDSQMRYDRYNFRANIDINVTRTTEFSLSLSNVYTTKNRPGVSLYEIYWKTLRTTPIATPTEFSDGTIALVKQGFNPWYELNYTGYAQDFSNTSQSLASLTQDLSDVVPGLKLNAKFAWDACLSSHVTRTKSPAGYSASGRDEDGNIIYEKRNDGKDYLSSGTSYDGGKYSCRSIAFEAAAIYDHTFVEKHHVSAMMNFNMRSLTYTFPASYEQSFDYRNNGIAGRATYSFDNRYFAEFNFGYNGSENFSPKKRFGFFPSYALGYIISNEKFWEPITNTISLLKLKASYGEIGNDQIGGNRRFAFNTTMQSGYGYNWGSKPTTSNGAAGVTTGIPGNENVTWEKAIKKNLGVELGFFNSALTINADYFYEKRSGIFILQQSVPTVVGNNVAQYVNIGKMRNQGIDLTAEFNKPFGDWFVNARGTFTYNRNRKVYDDMPTPQYPYLAAAGFPYLQDKGLIALGLFESEEDIANSPKQTYGNVVRPGDIKYKDINGDNVIDDLDKVAIGYSQIPEISYGFGASVTWKGIDLSVFFQGVGHITRIIGGGQFWGSGYEPKTQGQIFAEVADNRWSLSNPDPNAMYPRLAADKVANNQVASTFWQRDCSFIRLKNAELGYTFPKAWFRKVGVSSLRLYVSGNNLLTFSKFKLWDPELETSAGEKYPQMRTAVVGLNVNF